MNICVFGAASNEIDKSYIRTAEKLGEIMAKKGHSLVFGAGGNGMMGAVARGMYKNGGKIYGVIPEFFKDEFIEKIFGSCTELIFTKTMAERKTKMEDMADAFIVLPGGIGTFEEFFQVLTLKQLGRHVKPIAIFNINGYYEDLENFLIKSAEEKFIRNNCALLYGYLDDAEKVIEYIENDKQIKHDVHELKNG